MKIEQTARMRAISEFFDGVPHYFVGGAVRDLLMGNEPHDYDLTTPMTPEGMEAYIHAKNRRVWKIGQKFGTVGVKIDGELVEITTFRTEQYKQETGRKPEVQWGTDIADDLKRRDFTINAIAARPDGSIIDPFNGEADIRSGILRAVGAAKTRFKEDPLRILRAVRFAARYGFFIEETTAKKMGSMRWELLRLSKERITDEIGKMMLLPSKRAASAIKWMFGFGLWQPLFPELHLQFGFDQQNPHHAHKLHDHSLIVMESALHWAQTQAKDDRDGDHGKILAGWSALLHDVGKPFVKTMHKSGTRYNYIDHDTLGAEIAKRWLTDFRFSKDDVNFISVAVRDHLKDDHWLRPHDKAGKTTDPSYYLPGGGPHPKLMEGAATYLDRTVRPQSDPNERFDDNTSFGNEGDI